ncbi:MAG: PcfJ domain-containing protein [Bacilli bacterium]|nr:PcfJ domain-containing protein [Bacilli bacterium]
MHSTQLKFDNDFKNIILKPPSFWKKCTDIPDNIRQFIDEFSNNIIIRDSDNSSYYCSCCLNELDDYYCSNCDKNYKELKYDPTQYFNVIDNVYSFNKLNYSAERYYFVFDVVDGEVILYSIKEVNSGYIYTSFHRSVLSIENAYWICEDSIVDLLNNRRTYYSDIDTQTSNRVFDFLFIDFDLDTNIDDDYMYRRTLYVDNLDILKDTIYKYTNIWDAKDFLRDFDFRILNLTYIPLRFKQFEYLIKYKLYNLAFTASHLLNGKTFKERFGVEKEFLFYMQNINIDYYELLGLQLTKCRNRFLIGCVGNSYEFAKELFELVSLNMNEFAKFLERFAINRIPEYYDYINMAIEMGYDLSNKKVLYPDNFMQEHDRLYIQYRVLSNPEIVNNISTVSNVSKFNIYEDEKYIIFPADTIESMIDEGSQQHNCLRTYISSYSDNLCQIYFMRLKKEKTKSFVTIEVRNNRIVQARAKFNDEPSKEIMNILKKWEKTLLPIENEY